MCMFDICIYVISLSQIEGWNRWVVRIYRGRKFVGSCERAHLYVCKRMSALKKATGRIRRDRGGERVVLMWVYLRGVK